MTPSRTWWARGRSASIGWDTLYPLAPRPLLVLESTADAGSTYSPRYLESGREEVEKLRWVYALLGERDHLRWVESDEPHGLTAARRGEIEGWLGRFLLGEGAPGGEPAGAPEPEEATWVVAGGNVRALGGRTPRELACEEARRRPPAVLEVVRPLAGLAPAELARVAVRGGSLASIEVQSAPSVWLPAWLFEPAEAARSVVIALGAQEWEAGGGGREAVCVADVRGTGALAVRAAPDAPGYARRHADEESYAWGSLILGESLLAQRVADVLALVEALANHPRLGGLRLTLAARGELAVPALFAAAVEPRIEVVYLDEGLASLRSVLEVEGGSCPLASVVPGVAAGGDLPQVAATVGPRRVVLAGAVDATGRALDENALRRLYREAENVVVDPCSWPLTPACPR